MLLHLLLFAFFGCKDNTKITSDTNTPDNALVDNDGDGFFSNVDCDDSNPNIHPDAEEICDGLNNDCDAAIDEPSAADASQWYVDWDQDGFGDPNQSIQACEAPILYISNAGDCNDSTELANPDQLEICGNGLDDDCVDDNSVCQLSGSFDVDSADIAFEGEQYFDEFGAQVAQTDQYLMVSSTKLQGAFSSMGGFFAYALPLEVGDSYHWKYTSSEPVQLGSVMKSADINQDAQDDLVFGIPLSNAGELRGGAVGIFLAPFDTVPSDFDLMITGNDVFDELGQSVAISESGDAKLLIGAPKYGDTTQFYQGAAYLIDLSSFPTESQISITEAETIFKGENQNDYLGQKVQLSDINGDGLDDALIASTNWPTGVKQGRVSVFLAPFESEEWAQNADFQITSDSPATELASQILTPDLNQDGTNDIIVSAPNWQYKTGKVAFFFEIISDRTIEAPDLSLEGTGANQEFGAHISAAISDNTHFIVSNGRGEISYWIDMDVSAPQTPASADFNFDNGSKGHINLDINLDHAPDVVISNSEQPMGTLFGIFGIEQ